MLKTILAAIVAGAFFVSVPVFAEEAPAGEKGEKTKPEKKPKAGKKDKADTSEDGKKDKAAGAGW